MNGAVEGEPPSKFMGLDWGATAATICDAIADEASGLPDAAIGPT